jgi:phosphate transport system permease protein
MTDIATSPGATLVRSRSQNAQLISKRYQAERRFRAYGLVAIGITALFLVVLLGDILRKGLPAFTEHRLAMTITADQSAIDPQNTRDPRTLLAGDYDTLIRDALRAQFPEVTSRADRKMLLGLLSSGAADDFRAMISANPDLIGKEVSVPVLLSDDADQYLKGAQTGQVTAKGTGTLNIATEGDLYRLTSTSSDFTAAVALVKDYIRDSLATGSAELDRLNTAIAGNSGETERAEQRLQAATQSGDQAAITRATADRDKAAADLASLTSARDLIKARVDDLAQRAEAPQQAEKMTDRLPSLLIEAGGGVFRATELAQGAILAEALIAPTSLEAAAPGAWQTRTLTRPESDRRISDQESVWLERLNESGKVESGLAWRFFTSGDSREPELAGIRGALVGSILTLLVTLGLCLPLGVGAAIYLEEFAPKNRLTDIIEVNINNLAAVPSIVFGLLGLAMFLNFFGLPRSAPLVGGLVLALLVLPTIIIASRAALKAVPPSIKEAALGVGASHQQAIFHHVLPLAMPGIMTGTIIGMAHALGETAPLLMIGMVAFIVDIPGSITDAATALPVQIYLWSDLPEVAFQTKTAAAIIVLLVFLFVMNALAIYLRKRFERRW